ncbi:MAG: dephospho-CoA kinase [Deltaproteobacteria bacterium]|nr:dephospho-CoA kinase [Deltaproteobacteria bacterium]
MLKVGLTGGIASGKSTVSEIFASLGAQILDADEVAREVLLPGQPAWTMLRQAFGGEFFNADGTVRRKKLRKLVFADPEKRKQLDAIVHPEVMREINRRSETSSSSIQSGVLLVDVPLLLEVGVANRFDKVVVVYASERVQIKRLIRRDGISEEEAKQALKAQMVLKQKVEQADYVIDNNGRLEETQVQVQRVWQELLELARAKSPTVE